MCVSCVSMRVFGCSSHINQKTQFENPVLEAKKRLNQDSSALLLKAAGAMQGNPSVSLQPPSHAFKETSPSFSFGLGYAPIIIRLRQNGQNGQIRSAIGWWKVLCLDLDGSSNTSLSSSHTALNSLRNDDINPLSIDGFLRFMLLRRYVMNTSNNLGSLEIERNTLWHSPIGG